MDDVFNTAVLYFAITTIYVFPIILLVLLYLVYRIQKDVRETKKHLNDNLNNIFIVQDNLEQALDELENIKNQLTRITTALKPPAPPAVLVKDYLMSDSCEVIAQFDTVINRTMHCHVPETSALAEQGNEVTLVLEDGDIEYSVRVERKFYNALIQGIESKIDRQGGVFDAPSKSQMAPETRETVQVRSVVPTKSSIPSDKLPKINPAFLNQNTD